MLKQRLLSGVRGPSPSPSSAKGGALSRCVELWIADGQAAGWSPRTIAARRDMMGKFRWWLSQEGYPDRLEAITAETLRFFLAYVRGEAGTGRWGSDRPNAARPVRPSTVDTYYRALRAFFNFAIREGLLDESPLRKVRPPRLPKDLLPPFTLEQAQALIDAAKRSNQPLRNLALELILLDTGLRVSELCALTIGDVDADTKEITIRGKGGKRRVIYLSPPVRRALWRYVERERRMAREDEPLFAASRGRGTDSGLTPSGVGQLFRRLGRAAGFRDVVVSPHAARRYFAVSMLRNGANIYELQLLMGHEDLTVLKRYVSLAEADLALAHRKASPAARLKV